MIGYTITTQATDAAYQIRAPGWALSEAAFS
jgi:hypothetical protein